MVKGTGTKQTEMNGGGREKPPRHQDDPEEMTVQKKDKQVAKLMGGIRKRLAKIRMLSGSSWRHFTTAPSTPIDSVAGIKCVSFPLALNSPRLNGGRC